MQNRVIIVLINDSDFDLTVPLLEKVESEYKDKFLIFYVNNAGFEEKNYQLRFSQYSCLTDYLFLPKPLEKVEVIKKVSKKLKKHDYDFVYFINENFSKVFSYLDLLLSMQKSYQNSVLGIRGGSIFSAFFHNVSFFQRKTATDWLSFNGLLIPKTVWTDINIELNLRYYRHFYQVDYGFQLKKNGYKLFKLRPYIYKKAKGLDTYFRMRNPFLFLLFNYPKKRYVLGIFYFLSQLPYCLVNFDDRLYLSGLIDGFRLLFLGSPVVHHDG